LGVKEGDLAGMAKSAIGHGMVKMNPRQPNEAELLAILKKAL
jgi:alcohol dehydrogenase class IV